MPGLERRNNLRRVVCGGVVVGVIGGLLMSLAQLVSLLGDAVPSPAGVIRGFVGLWLLVGAIAGVVEGVVVATARPIIDRLSRRVTAHRWAALVYGVALAPVIVWVSTNAKWGSELVGAVALAALLAASFAALLVVFEVGARLELRVRQGEGDVRGIAIATAALLALGLVVSMIGGSSLGRELCAFGVFELAVLAASMAARAGERRWARMAAPKGALAFLFVAVAAGAFALQAVGDQGVSQVVEDHGAVITIVRDDATKIIDR
jgi:hypothetical protein